MTAEVKMIFILALSLLLTFNNVLAQEDCHKACDKKYKANQEDSSCKEGCRLAVVFTILHSLNGMDRVQKDCSNGCEEAYAQSSESKLACQFGCQNQHGTGSGQIVVTERDPISGVVQKAVKEDMQSSFLDLSPFSSYRSDFSDIEGTMNRMRAMHERMLRYFETLQKNHRMNPNRGRGNDVALHRPAGHGSIALQGPLVGNEDVNGDEIIKAKPVEHKVSISVYGSPEHYVLSRLQKPSESTSFVERLSQRARHMSILSQWLICIALLLCLLSMLGISLAIIRQIKLQQRVRARQTHVILPTTLGQPLPAKKVPLETPGAAMDYPLIHDTPPPAYDQLSVHKGNLQDTQKM